MRHNLSHSISCETNFAINNGYCFIMSHTNCIRTEYDVVKLMLDHDGMAIVFDESSIAKFRMPLSTPTIIPNFFISFRDLNNSLSFKSLYKILSDSMRL